jgi:hypothetical protein
MARIVHDENGNWTASRDIRVSWLADDEFDSLQMLDQAHAAALLQALPPDQTQRLLGFDGNGEDLDELLRAMTLLMPRAIIDEDNVHKRFTIDTGLWYGDEGELREAPEWEPTPEEEAEIDFSVAIMCEQMQRQIALERSGCDEAQIVAAEMARVGGSETGQLVATPAAQFSSRDCVGR